MTELDTSSAVSETETTDSHETQAILVTNEEKLSANGKIIV